MAGVKGRSGGPRPGSGRKKKPDQLIVGPAAPQSPLEFLESVMLDASVDARLRVQAASVAAQYRHTKLSDGGKKDARKDAAEAASNGKFSGAEAPRLVRDNTKAA